MQKKFADVSGSVIKNKGFAAKCQVVFTLICVSPYIPILSRKLKVGFKQKVPSSMCVSDLDVNPWK